MRERYLEAISESEKMLAEVSGEELTRDLKAAVVCLLETHEIFVGEYDDEGLKRASDFYLNVMRLARSSESWEDFVEGLILFDMKLRREFGGGSV